MNIISNIVFVKQIQKSRRDDTLLTVCFSIRKLGSPVETSLNMNYNLQLKKIVIRNF
jgi:hypothetical protein